jgi:hypothetical protein
MKKNVFLKGIALFLALLGTYHGLWAQNEKVSGKITDGKGEALAGVSVVVKGTTKGTSSDANGMYVDRSGTPAQALVFSFVGFKPQEVRL